MISDIVSWSAVLQDANRYSTIKKYFSLKKKRNSTFQIVKMTYLL